MVTVSESVPWKRGELSEVEKCMSCSLHVPMTATGRTRGVISIGPRERQREIRPVPHRHFIFALPKVLRPAFRYRRRLLPKLALCAWKALSTFLRKDTGGDALAAAIVSIQTAGEFLNWHPHLHVLAPAGAFRADGERPPEAAAGGVGCREG